MAYEICLFDLDGTLTDPKEGICKSYQYALSAFGISEELENLSKFIGPPLREVFEKFYKIPKSDIERCVGKFREYFAEKGLYENAVYSGIPQALQTLKDKGKVLAVATSKVTGYAEKILKHFDLEKYFSFVSGDDMEGTLTKEGKREVIRIALNAVDPQRKMNAVMIGDRKHDIQGAKALGIDSIGICYGYGSREELEEAGASFVLNSVEELVEFFK